MFKITFSDGRKFTGVYLSVAFKDGEGTTDSDYLADRFKAKGLIVEAEKTGTDNPFSGLKKADLEAKATEMGVDISGCKTNKECAALLMKAFKASE